MVGIQPHLYTLKKCVNVVQWPALKDYITYTTHAEAEETLELQKNPLFDSYSKMVFFGNLQPLSRQI